MISSFTNHDLDRLGITSNPVPTYLDDPGGFLGNLTSLATTTLFPTDREIDYYNSLRHNNTISEWLELRAENVSDIGANTTETPYTPYESRPETYIIPIVFALIFIVGVLGNGTLVIVFLKHRTMRNVPNM